MASKETSPDLKFTVLIWIAEIIGRIGAGLKWMFRFKIDRGQVSEQGVISRLFRFGMLI